MTINKNSTEQINVALLDLENKIKRNNQTAAISALENNIALINKTLKEKQNGLVPGETYNINISGNAATSNHSLTADNATTADSANTATTAGYANNAAHADNADSATHSTTSDYATSAGTAAILFPEGFVYQQPYRTPSPAQMNMQVPAGCAWVDISNEFSGDYFRVKKPRWHPSQPTVSAKVTAYDSSTKVVTIESGVIVEGQVWDRDIVRNNITGALAWTTARTSETIDGVTYNKTFTLDININITVGQYISFSHGDAMQQHCHSGTTSWVGDHQHTSNVSVGLSNAAGSNTWCLVPRNVQSWGSLSGTSSAAGGHNHTMTTGNALAYGSTSESTIQVINTRDDTRVQCTLMTIWQVQQI